MPERKKIEPLLDSTEAARLLNINPHTLQRMARLGQVPALKLGKLWRFQKSALDEWVASKVSFFHHPCQRMTKGASKCIRGKGISTGVSPERNASVVKMSGNSGTTKQRRRATVIPAGRRVLAPLPPPPAAARFYAHPQLRISC
ncbi:MAG: hypothetical protein DMG86_09860 [Acidobacteria bacterium]|nr:MAG: hypothetical protein DMG86_09860 [Acidobacteriota bacterium]